MGTSSYVFGQTGGGGYKGPSMVWQSQDRMLSWILEMDFQNWKQTVRLGGPENAAVFVTLQMTLDESK